MKQNKFLLPMLMAATLLMTIQTSSRADLTAGQVVAQFNSLNGGKGIYFTGVRRYNTPAANETRVENLSGYQFADTSAYNNALQMGDSNYFRTITIKILHDSTLIIMRN
jgi:hypothetical protein